MEKRQLDILRHALGISASNPTGYRNHFVSGPGCDHFADCEALESQGMMVRRHVPFFDERDVSFFVTDKGRKAASGGEEGK